MNKESLSYEYTCTVCTNVVTMFVIIRDPTALRNFKCRECLSEYKRLRRKHFLKSIIEKEAQQELEDWI